MQSNAVTAAEALADACTVNVSASHAAWNGAQTSPMPKKISTDPRSRIIRKEMADSSGRSGYGRKQSGSPVWEIRRALRKRRAARRVCGEPAHPEDASVREIAEALVGIGEKSAPAVFGFVGCVTVVPVAIRVHFFTDGMRRNPVIHPVGVDRIRGKFSAVKRAEQIAGIPADQHADVRTGAVEITLENWQEYLEINQYLGVSYNTNSFGEVTDTCLKLYTILELKEEYSNVEMDWREGDCIAVEYDSDCCVSDIIYNLDDFSFELIDCVSHPDATVDESSFVRGMTSQIPNGVSICRYRIVDGKVEHDYIHYAMNTEKKGMSFGDPYRECVHIEQNEDGTGYIANCPTNIQITRIQGTLKYYE